MQKNYEQLQSKCYNNINGQTGTKINHIQLDDSDDDYEFSPVFKKVVQVHNVLESVIFNTLV